jgi:hypothetical protein
LFAALEPEQNIFAQRRQYLPLLSSGNQSAMRIKIDQRDLKATLAALLATFLLVSAASMLAQCPPSFVENFDGVAPPALPSGWVASQGANVTGAPLWVTSNVASHSWPNDAFSTAPGNILDNRLDTPLLSASIFDPGISFQNNYNLESGRDGAVLEISSPNINGGAFTDITDPAVGGSVSPGYNSVISSAFQSPIAGRMAWSGNSGGYVSTQAFFGNAAFPLAHNVTVRFRLVSDNSGASAGWRIDTFSVPHNECSSPTPAPSACPLQPWTFAANYPLPVIEQNAMGTSGFFAYSAGGYTSPAETNAFYRYDPAANSWTALPPLPVALARARGIYSPTTASFCVFGGLNQSTVLDTTYIYNVSANTWSTGAPMPAPRYLPNVAYYNGKIFVIGGHTGSSEASQTWEYDPTANTWNTARADIPVAMGGSATGMVEHFIYLVSHLNGGAGSSLHYRYDITFNTWTLMPPAPATLYQPVGATIGRQICVVGGPNSANAPSGPHTGSYIYDTFFNSWTTGPNTNIPHAYAGGTSLIGNRLLVVGGYAYGSADTNLVETAVTSCAPTSSPTPTPTATPTPTISATPTPTPSATATPPVTPTPTPSPTVTPSPAPAQALNISTRLRVETGDRVMIGGFIITGNVPEKVAVRGLGPSLNNFGLSDLLADPTLELRGSDGALLMQNDNWQDNPSQAAQLIVLGLAPQNPNESGIVATLPPGAYTALMAGKNQTSGIGLVEIYDVDAAAASQLANISTRGFVQTANNVMIGGFILGHGSASTSVAVRGLGPSLSQFGLSNVLADPTLELRDSNGALLIANDNWQDEPISAAQLAAHGLAPPSPLESGIFATLSPGAFTAILAGKNGGVGLGLVEVYSGLRAARIVTSPDDSGPGSLRETIAAARDGDTIGFVASLMGQTINLISGELLIDKSITIQGFELYRVLVRNSTSGTTAFRVFHITPGHTVVMQGLDIAGGDARGGFPANCGGGIYNDGSTLTIVNCSINGNRAGSTGIPGEGAGIFNNSINSGQADLTITRSDVLGNEAFGNSSGGGIHNNGAGQTHHATLVLNETKIRWNSASTGAGIYNNGFYTGDATLVVNNSTISGNVAMNGGGGISNSGTFMSGHASLTVSNSTISSNSARIGGAILNSGEGGSATLEIVNSTMSDNSAVEQGGGLYNTGATAATRSGGGIYPDGSGGSATASISNTVLKAGTSGENIYNLVGAVTSAGYNLSSDDGGGFLTATGDQINTNPMVGPLEDNGGPTLTNKLLSGSPAIDAGDPNFTPPPAYDQRGPGSPRVIGGRIDVGSFELQP